MSDVWFCSSPGSDGVEDEIGRVARDAFPAGGRVALKLHMGEGSHHFEPGLAARAVSVLKGLGMRPFLFDSPVTYPGHRHTAEGYLERARENGFSEETMHCPVVVSDASEPVRGRRLEVGVCSDLVRADALFALTHFKGHPCSGVGGALKNLGMGGVDRKTKSAIHGGSLPVLTGKCNACGACVEGCPGEALEVRDRVVINARNCWGCGRCMDQCPEKALTPREGTFDELLIDAAAGVLSRIDRALYLNDVRRITRLCDCASDPGPEIAPDIGVLLTTDPVAVDRASLDLTIRRAGEDVFRREHGRDAYRHVREAEARGLGHMKYRLVGS